MADIISPEHTANFLLAECREQGEVLTNLKLQKLLFYSQAWFLALENRPLFAEDFQAWVHGPVLPSQYHRFKEFTWRPLTIDVATPKVDDSVGSHLMSIIEEFGTETAVALERMTHLEKPWLAARGDLGPSAISDAKISKVAMMDYYRSMMD